MNSNHPTNSTVLIAGCGDVGAALGRLLAAQGFNVYGLRRTINQLPDCIQGITADLSLPETLQQLPAADFIVYCASASEHNEQGYRSAYIDGLNNLLTAMPATAKHLFFTSSTGVYHQKDHQPVNEQSPCKPERFSGQIMLQAEQQVLNNKVSASVIRFSGIYGPGRTRMLEQVYAGKGAAIEPLSYSNRIHRDDCAGILAHLVQQAWKGKPLEEIYLASDDHPAPLAEVTQWLAHQLQVSITDESMARFAGSKQCDNQRIKDSGYQFKYPNYKVGYTTLLKTFVSCL